MRRARWSGFSPIGIFAVLGGLAAAVTLIPSNVGRAALQKPAQSDAPAPESHVLSADDGFNIHIRYYRSPAESTKDAAVVVLLHMKDGNRFVWEQDGGIAQALQSKGFAVITVDLRYHGESKANGAAPVPTTNQGKKGKKDVGLPLRPADFQAMVQLDLEAVKKFIFEEHQVGRLNMNKMGIVGPEMGASIAVNFAVYDWAKEPYEDGQPGFQTPRGQDVQALVLISPEESFHGSGIKMTQLMPAIKDPAKNISVLICCGNDPKEEAHAKKVFDIVNPPLTASKDKERLNGDRMRLYVLPARLTGTNLLDQRLDIEKLIVNFFDKYLKTVNSVWRDRESKRKKKK